MRRTWVVSVVVFVSLGTGTVYLLARGGTAERASVGGDCGHSRTGGACGATSMSADGRYVAFSSWASSVVADDAKRGRNVFVHDRVTGETARVSVASDGSEADRHSLCPAISGDGRYVAYTSAASNLAPGDGNGSLDVFVHDRVTRETVRVSVASDGSEANHHSCRPSISGDGRWVAFQSLASNLVPKDTNNAWDVFVHDRVTGKTARVSVSSDGTQPNHHSLAPSISEDGRWVAFDSRASDLVADDTNAARDVFVHDRQTGETSIVSAASDGAQGNATSRRPSISADGRHVAFVSAASNLVANDTNGARDVFAHDRVTRQTVRVSVASDGTQANDESCSPCIGTDGRCVAFKSAASNLAADDTKGSRDVFVHDLATGETARASAPGDGTRADGLSSWPSMSGDGRYVAFISAPRRQAPGDSGGALEVFVHDRATGRTARTSAAGG